MKELEESQEADPESDKNRDVSGDSFALRMEEALRRGVDGSDEYRREFYDLVLSGTVIVPVVEAARARSIPMLGNDSVQSLGYLLIQHEGRHILPCFTRSELLAEWAEAEQPVSVSKEFTTILSILNGETWVHLNPGQNYGKEFSPWEIGLLRSGVDAIADIVQDLNEGEMPDLEVTRAGENYDELKRRLKILFEVYREVEEAFMIEMVDKSAVNRGDSKSGDISKALVGLKLADSKDSSDAKEVRLKQLQIEIDMTARSSLEPYREVVIVHDLARDNSPNWKILDKANPFYIKQLIAGEVDSFGNAVPMGKWTIFKKKVSAEFSKWRQFNGTR